jgi:hypothetical protein
MGSDSSIVETLQRWLRYDCSITGYDSGAFNRVCGVKDNDT